MAKEAPALVPAPVQEIDAQHATMSSLADKLEAILLDVELDNAFNILVVVQVCKLAYAKLRSMRSEDAEPDPLLETRVDKLLAMARVHTVKWGLLTLLGQAEVKGGTVVGRSFRERMQIIWEENQADQELIDMLGDNVVKDIEELTSAARDSKLVSATGEGSPAQRAKAATTAATTPEAATSEVGCLSSKGLSSKGAKKAQRKSCRRA